MGVLCPSKQRLDGQSVLWKTPNGHKESDMPKGKGTYGSKVGRPKKKKKGGKKKKSMGGLTAAQKKLPKALQAAILKRKKKKK